jgi:CheY-like chemotaxis protein
MPRSFVLLVIAADPLLAEQIRAFVGGLSLSYECHVVRSSRQAFGFLQRKAPFQEAPRPDLILLVSHLSGNHGPDVLRSIKSNPAFCRIPVIVASGKDCLQDFPKKAEYQTRPLSAEDARILEISLGLLKEIGQFWASPTQLPR